MGNAQIFETGRILSTQAVSQHFPLHKLMSTLSHL